MVKTQISLSYNDWKGKGERICKVHYREWVSLQGWNCHKLPFISQIYLISTHISSHPPQSPCSLWELITAELVTHCTEVTGNHVPTERLCKAHLRAAFPVGIMCFSAISALRA